MTIFSRQILLAGALTTTGTGLLAADIDLDCGQMSAQAVSRLETAGLLVRSDSSGQQAGDIIRELCSNTQARTRQQHEADIQRALDNWFLEDRPDKAGNRRLKNLKR